MHIRLIIEVMCVATIVMTRMNTNSNRSTNTTKRTTAQKTKRSRLEDAKEITVIIAKRVVAAVVALFSFALLIGGVTLLYVGATGRPVPQLYLKALAGFTYQSIIIFWYAILSFAILCVIYAFFRIMVKKARRIARKMLPEYRGTWDRYARVFNVGACICESIFHCCGKIISFIATCLDEID